VWIDLANDRSPDGDNLSALGISGVTVNLFEVDGSTTNFFDSMTTTTNGFYLFDDLAPGTYFVQVDPANVPATLSMITTFDSFLVTLGPGDSSLTNDFGFAPPPSAVELVNVGATAGADGTTVSWTTALEDNSLGFNVYGSMEAGGPEALVNEALILAEGGDALYQLVDASGYNYYRLEEIDADLNAVDLGTIAVRSLAFVEAAPGMDVLQNGEALPALAVQGGLVVYATAAELFLAPSDAPTRMGSGSGIDPDSPSPFVVSLDTLVFDVANPGNPVHLLGEPLESGDGATYFAPSADAVIETTE